jgi:hypothetical protein
MQDRLIVGDTLKFNAQVPDYPPSQGYALTYRLVRRDGTPGAITINATTSGEDYQVTVVSATTIGWTPGVYTWAAYASKAGERYTVDSGEITLVADPVTSAAPFDMRGHAAKVLASIEALLEGKAAADVVEYSIAGRSIKKMSFSELLVVRQKYQDEIRTLEAVKRMQNGLGGGRRIQVAIR